MLRGAGLNIKKNLFASTPKVITFCKKFNNFYTLFSTAKNKLIKYAIINFKVFTSILNLIDMLSVKIEIKRKRTFLFCHLHFYNVYSSLFM